MTIPQGPNQRWSLNFVSDAFVDGRRFRILSIVDDFNRECLALVADASLPGMRVVRELERKPIFEKCESTRLKRCSARLTPSGLRCIRAALRWSGGGAPDILSGTLKAPGQIEMWSLGAHPQNARQDRQRSLVLRPTSKYCDWHIPDPISQSTDHRSPAC
jgi:hypothetical protein